MKIMLYSMRRMVLAIACVGMMSGCNSWLDLLPENSQSSDQFWNTKEDVEAVMNSCYMGLRANLERFIQWGEVRGDGLDLSTTATSGEVAIKELQLDPTNAICNWSNLYTVIGRANAVLQYAPQVKEIDPTFETSYLNALVAEATIVRAYCYFYLVRVFGDVPLVLSPYVDDSYAFIIPKTGEAEILRTIKQDLTDVMAWARPQFGTVWETKGRASRWAAYALLADICLWTEDYDGCITACEAIEASGNFSLLPSLDWLSIFARENTREGIFELQWDYASDNTSNSLYTWFYQTPRYTVSPQTQLLFKEQ
ncbi:MAG: RagB/SusD family nutrient uptake outer membrane protein, partial [Odoribacteraceae bacterium]|nr:RagB/SusD family nutrient uptake outer membrane protein [Odoribacteraceae bacterium]